MADKRKSQAHLDRRDLLRGAAAFGLAAVLDPSTARRCPTRKRSPRPDPLREREAGHDRLAAQEHSRRSEDEVPLPLDRGLLLRTPACGPATPWRSWSAPTRPRPSSSTCTASATTAARAAGTCSGSAPSRVLSSPTRRWVQSACASAAGSRPPSSSSPRGWPSGVYLGKLTAEKDGLQSYVIFIVRDDRACDFLFQCSDTTWSAYNRWPDQWSLYDDGKKQWYWGPGVRVSWDRPYGKYCQVVDAPLSQGSGEFLLWEFPLALLDGEGGLRRLLHQQRGHPRRRQGAAAGQGLAVGGARRVLVAGNVPERPGGDRRGRERGLFQCRHLHRRHRPSCPALLAWPTG